MVEVVVGEGGIRVPLIIVPPKDHAVPQPGGLSDTVVSGKDISATVLDYTGVKHPGQMFLGRDLVQPWGISMVPYLSGNKDQVRDQKDWFAFELFGNSFVIQGDYKAIFVRPGMYGVGRWHLYNITADPGETTPLDDEEAARLESMTKL